MIPYLLVLIAVLFFLIGCVGSELQKLKRDYTSLAIKHNRIQLAYMKLKG